MQTVALSAEALALLKLHIERKGDIDVDHSNREIYRELERAGIVAVGHSFRDGEGLDLSADQGRVREEGRAAGSSQKIA